MSTYVFAPSGWVKLLNERPALAETRHGKVGPRTDLDAVNLVVNRGIIDRADKPGADEWSIAAVGDCEDHALMKRALLIGLGWPSSALRLAVCNLASGEAHLVLVVDMPGERLVLDNIIGAVTPPGRTGYTFKSIQDAKNPRLWNEWPV